MLRLGQVHVTRQISPESIQLVRDRLGRLRMVEQRPLRPLVAVPPEMTKGRSRAVHLVVARLAFDEVVLAPLSHVDGADRGLIFLFARAVVLPRPVLGLGA